MTRNILFVVLVLVNTNVYAKQCSNLLDFHVKTLAENKVVNLCQEYQGKVILIVNTASKCAFTDQYESLERLYEQYKDRGFVVLGFPSNDFGGQEPGNEKQIKSFCRLTYGVDFPMFSKTNVLSHNADPLYAKLASESGRYPRWNFHKYLIGRDGKLVTDYPGTMDPMKDPIRSDIEKQLGR